MYRNTTTPGILELDRGADLGPPPPDEGAEPLSPPRVRIRYVIQLSVGLHDMLSPSLRYRDDCTAITSCHDAKLSSLGL